MIITAPDISEKLKEIIHEMKEQQLWIAGVPVWVSEYETKPIQTQQDFIEWLQFIFLPNHLLNAETGNMKMHEKNNIVLQAKVFFGQDLRKGRLLQLLIELDAIL